MIPEELKQFKEYKDNLEKRVKEHEETKAALEKRVEENEKIVQENKERKAAFWWLIAT